MHDLRVSFQDLRSSIYLLLLRYNLDCIPRNFDGMLVIKLMKNKITYCNIIEGIFNLSETWKALLCQCTYLKNSK